MTVRDRRTLTAVPYSAPPPVGRLRRVGRWWASPRGYTFSFVFGLVLLGLLGWLIVGHGSTPTAVRSTQIGAGPVQVAPTVVQPSLPCPDQPVASVTPEQLVLTEFDTVWKPAGELKVPTSPSGGPFANGSAQCFAHSPEGALYAVASRIVAEANTAGVSNWRFSGYQWNSTFTPEQVTVTIAIAQVAGPPKGAARPWLASWVNGDWQIDPLSGVPTVAVNGMQQFTAWGGN